MPAEILNLIKVYDGMKVSAIPPPTDPELNLIVI